MMGRISLRGIERHGRSGDSCGGCGAGGPLGGSVPELLDTSEEPALLSPILPLASCSFKMGSCSRDVNFAMS